jgi:hypothetical protein
MKIPVDIWLIALANHLRGKGLTCELAYDDIRLGDLLALSVPTPRGLCELDVRRKPKGAVLILCAESADALRVVTDTLGPLHQTIRRLENAKRKFVHRIERMVEHLVGTFEERAGQFPMEALNRLRGLFPEAAPMTGIEALFRAREHSEESVVFVPGAADRCQVRQARRYPSRFAAKIPTEQGGRAALFEPGRGQFRLRGEAAKVLESRLLHDQRAAEDFAVAHHPRPAPADAPAAARASSAAPVAQTASAADGALTALACIDCATALPDCNAVDVPDFSGCSFS